MFSADPKVFISLEGVAKALGCHEAYESGQPTPKQDREEHDRLAIDWAEKMTRQLKDEWWALLGTSQRQKVATEIAKRAARWPQEIQQAIVESLQQV
jgi:hypothetical protein